MPIGNSDFSRDFLAGAQIGNMRVAQQERMMQLRSQAALNAIHERQLAAQADMLVQNARHLQLQNQALGVVAQEHQADMNAIEGANYLYQVGADKIDSDDEKTPEERTQLKSQLRDTLYQQTAMQRPGAGRMLYQAIAPEMKQQLGEQAIQQRGQASQNTLQAKQLQTQAFQQRTQAMVEKLKANGVGHEAATTFSNNINEWRQSQQDAEESGNLDEAALYGQKIQDAYQFLNRTHPDASANIHIKNLQQKAHAAYKAWLDTGMRNKKLKDESERAQDELAKAQENTPSASAAPTTGAAPVKPASDTTKVLVRKDGKTYRLPKDQLEEAKNQGYEEVK